MKMSGVALGAGLSIAVMIAGYHDALAQDSVKPKMQCLELFAAMDADKDGEVSLEEFMAVEHPRGNAEAIFHSRDADGDGALTEVEFCVIKGMGGGMGQGKRK
jgi:hypothetical protein